MSLATRSGSSPSLRAGFAQVGARKRILSGLNRVSLERPRNGAFLSRCRYGLCKAQVMKRSMRRAANDDIRGFTRATADLLFGSDLYYRIKVGVTYNGIPVAAPHHPRPTGLPNVSYMAVAQGPKRVRRRRREVLARSRTTISSRRCNGTRSIVFAETITFQ